MLIEAATTLKVLAGVVGVGYSIYSNRTADGAFDFNEIPKAIFGTTVGELFTGWLKAGSDAAYKKFLDGYNALDKDALNHDLQRAALKAQLLATFFASQACLVELKTGRGSLWLMLREEGDQRWLTNVTKYLKGEIKKLEDRASDLQLVNFDSALDRAEILSIFDPGKTDDPQATQKQVSDKLKKSVLRDLESNYFGVAFNERAFGLLKDKIEKGWQEFPEDKDFSIQLKLKNRAEKTYDWFELVCIFFTEEYKENPRVKAAILRQAQITQLALHNQQINLLNNITRNLDAFGTLGAGLDDLLKRIADFQEENFYLHKVTHEKLDLHGERIAVLNERIDTLIRATLEAKEATERDTIEREKEIEAKVSAQSERAEAGTVLSDFSNFKRPTRFFNRESDVGKLKEFVLRNPQPITVIKGAGGFGKTALAEHFLKEIAPQDKIADTKIVNEIVIFSGLRDLTFENLFYRSAQLLDRAFRAGGKASSSSSLPEVLQDQEMDDERRIIVLFEQLRRLGKVWFFFDNCESVLTQENVLADERLTKFLEMTLNYKDHLRLILTTREVPVFEGLKRVSLLEMQGQLPAADAVSYLKQLAEDLNTEWNGASERETEDLLARLAEKLRYIPMALFSFANYYSQDREKPLALKNVLEREELFADFAKFDLEKGYAKLIGEQFEVLSPLERAVWRVLSVFREPVSAEAIKFVLSDYELAGVWKLLHGSGSVIVHKREINGERFYLFSLEQSAKDYVYQRLPAEASVGDEQSQFFNRRQLNLRAARYYDSIRKPIKASYTRADFAPYFAAIDHFRAAEAYDEVVELFNEDVNKLGALGYMQEILERCPQLTGKLSRPEWEAKNLNNIGFALDLSGRLSEAIGMHDKAIEIYEKLITEDDDDLGHYLANSHIHKGNAYRKLGDLPGALREFTEAMKIFIDFITKNPASDSGISLAIALMDRSNILYEMGELEDAVRGYDTAIEYYDELIKKEGRVDLIEEAARVYTNKGNVLDDLGRTREALAEFDKAIGIREGLVNQGGRVDIADALAMSYMGKAILLNRADKTHEAIVEHDKAARIIEGLVHGQGRTDLLEKLALIYLNKGMALYNLGKLDEEIVEYNKSIRIREELVFEQGRTESAHGLAMAYLNKGVTLDNLGRLDEAIRLHSQAIELWANSISRGEAQNIPKLAEGLRNRGVLLFRTGKLREAEGDMSEISRLFELTQSIPGGERLAEKIMREIYLFRREIMRVQRTPALYIRRLIFSLVLLLVLGGIGYLLWLVVRYLFF